MQYLQVSSHRLKSNKKVELDPIPGLIFVLLIKNDDKDDKMSQDLVWGLRTLQDKRQDLGPKNSEVASVLNFIGTLLFHQQELDHALLFFQEELRLEEQFMGSEDDVSVSVTCNNIGRILQELGRYPQAIYYYQRSLRHRYGDDFFGKPASSCGAKGKTSQCRESSIDEEAVGDIPAATMNLYSTVWYNLGLIHDKMGAFAEAIRAFRMSLKLRRAMLGRDHSDVACLLYNIGVLQMEQQLLNEATDSFREALRIRRVAATGQLNDRHVVKTLQKLASLHKSKGNIQGALEACEEVMSVLKASVDFEWCSRTKSMGMTLREISELHHAEGNPELALERAVESFNLLRSVRSSICEEQQGEHSSSLEQETAALLLIGSLQHEACAPMEACSTFAEAARLIHSCLNSTLNVATGTISHPNAATLLPLLEVSTMLAYAHCAPEA
jgi:tetratricopeptide (TPR) repeat protein